MKVSALNFRLAVVLVCLWSAPGLMAEDSSLSDPNLETAEAKVTSETLLSQNDLLRRQLSLDRETQKTLTDSLVVSNAEAELFRRKYSELQTRMDALGVESVSKDRAKLEQRLLKAVSDLQLMNKEKEAYREQLLKLTETMLRYVKSTPSGDPEARAEVEAQLRSTNKLLAAKDASAPNDEARSDLMNGKVLSVKEEWSLVVGNLGAQQGVKIGMPLRVVRGGKTVATLRVVDVREKISGAVIQELDSEKIRIKVGDGLQGEGGQDVSLKWMQGSSTYRYAKISAFKAREVTRAIQGLPVSAALDIVAFSPKKAAGMISKTLKSAIANAENNANLRVDGLVVKEATVGEGPTMKRMMTRARGSGSTIRKRSAHIRIILTYEIEIKAREKKSWQKKSAPEQHKEHRTKRPKETKDAK